MTDATNSETNEIAGKIDLLTFPVQPLGCNCSILIHKDSREAIVVDPGGDAPKIIEYLEERQARVRWIVHTHAHFDHCLGTHEVTEYARQDRGENTSAANEGAGNSPAVKVGLHQDDMFLYENLGAQCRLFGLPPADAKTTIDHHFTDEEPLIFGDMHLKVLHTPGHTPGSCCFSIAEAGLVFSGDTLFQMGIGRTDLPGGDPDAITKSIRDRLFTLDDGTNVIPGHGRFTRIYDEKRMNPFF